MLDAGQPHGTCKAPDGSLFVRDTCLTASAHNQPNTVNPGNTLITACGGMVPGGRPANCARQVPSCQLPGGRPAIVLGGCPAAMPGGRPAIVPGGRPASGLQ